MNKSFKTDKLITDLGQRLREERLRLGLSQEQFGALGGVQRETQYLYERGTRIPSVEYFFGVITGGASLDYLVFGERGRGQRGDLCINREVLAAVYRLVEEFGKDTKGKRLSPDQRTAVFGAICDAVAGKSHDEVDWNALRVWPKVLLKSNR
jgi:transcriptional regulator with XRE-family HTH domain